MPLQSTAMPDAKFVAFTVEPDLLRGVQQWVGVGDPITIVELFESFPRGHVLCISLLIRVALARLSAGAHAVCRDAP